jgi:hypothetical protein
MTGASRRLRSFFIPSRSKEARETKYQGTCIIALIVEADGLVRFANLAVEAHAKAILQESEMALEKTTRPEHRAP